MEKALVSSAVKAETKFSGEFDFAETSDVFPITHMVAPMDKSLTCAECHSKTDSRLANLKGFYMHCCACVHDSHRSHAVCPHPGDDYGPARSGGQSSIQMVHPANSDHKVLTC
jgi:hypothetical protein